MEQKSHKDFGPIFWIHLFYIFLIYSSPFWLSWKWVPLGIIGVYIQWMYFGGCVLTLWEFGKTEHNSFVWYYLNRLGLRFSLKRVKEFTDYWTALYLITCTFIWQIILRHAALI